MLQSLTGKLNRLNDVREIGDEIAAELRSLIDYHNCRVFVVDGDELVPIAFRGEFTSGDRSAAARAAADPKSAQGITGRCAELGESLLIGDAANCEFGNRIPGTPVIEESLLAVPLRYGSHVVGVIVVSKLGLDQFDEDDVRLLEVLAGHAAVASRTRASTSRRGARRRARPRCSSSAASSRRSSALDDILARVVELSAGILGSPRTRRSGSRTGRLAAARGRSTATRRSRRSRSRTGRFPPPRHCGARRATRRDRPPEDYAASHRDPLVPGGHVRRRPARGRRPRSAASSPLVHARRRSASASCACSAASRTRRSSRSRTRRATRGSSGRSSPRSRRSRTRSRRTTSTRRSTRAGSPTSRSASARELGLDERRLKRLELGALLHDIGKIGIPSDILAKPGRLTADERAVIQTHPELGERIIAPIDRLQDVRPIVRHCHERWDGRGYPDGLAGEEIPLESRIIFVCDAYHAMTTDRPYRKRLSHPEAVRRLREGAGTQFDPRVVDAAPARARASCAKPARASRPPPRSGARRPRARGRGGGTGRPARAARARCRAATIRPCSTTRISSARRTVERRWAMMIDVRPCSSRSSARSISTSVGRSMFEVASSRMRMRGSASRARAIEISCRSPAERPAPPSRTSCSRPPREPRRDAVDADRRRGRARPPRRSRPASRSGCSRRSCR